MFGDYYYKEHADSSNRGIGEYANMSEGTNAFDIRRAYLGYDYNISEKFSTEFLLSHEGNNTDSKGNRTVFVKGANVRWKKIFYNSDLVIGQMPTPTWSLLTEKIWGYRSVEKTITDMRRLASSSDLGIALQGKFDSKENFGYNILAANGAGTKLETDRFKKFYGDVWAKFRNKKIILDLYGDYERTQLSPFHKSKTTAKFFFAYQTEKITTGIEAYQQIQENNAVFAEFVPSTKIDTINSIAVGVSLFIRGTILKDKLNFFSRFDMYDPDVKFNYQGSYSGSYSAYNKENFFTTGLDYAPIKNVHIIPNIWYCLYMYRNKSTSGLPKDDYDMVARITFHYIFK